MAGPQIAIARLAHGAGLALPAYESAAAAGMDIAAAVPEGAPVVLQPGGRALVPTGFAIALPEGHEAQVRPRSGLALKHGVSVLNAPGTIDADYRGEVMVLLVNHGEAAFPITRGLRIAQIVVQPVARASLHEVTDLAATERGAAGFGSTGMDMRGTDSQARSAREP